MDAPDARPAAAAAAPSSPDDPDATLRYGSWSQAIIDVHLPPAYSPDDGARDLLVLLHGGFWREEYDRLYTRPLARALAIEGLVVATPEYRRVGGIGELAGGYPTTLDDVSAALGSVADLLRELDVTLGRVTVMGHSAGGHLALWAANEDVPCDRAIGLAPVADLRAAAAAHMGADAVQQFLGGEPDEVPDAYDAADPATRFARRPDCEVVIVHGLLDDVVDPANSALLDDAYPWVVRATLADSEHFLLTDPTSTAYPVVAAAALGRGIPGPVRS